MKRFFIISLIPILVFLLPLGLIGGSFFLTGCSEESPSHFDIDHIPPYSENLFSLSRYPYINEFFGTPDGNDFLNGVRLWGDTTTAAKSQGFLACTQEEADSRGFLAWLGVGLDESQEEVEAAEARGEEHPLIRREDAFIKIFEMSAYTGFTEVLNEVWAQLGVDWMTHHLFPLLRYWFLMDEEMYRNDFLENIQDKADSLGKISEEDFETLIKILDRMLDNDDKTYGIIWDAMPSAWDLIDTLRGVDAIDVGAMTDIFYRVIDFLRNAVDELTEVNDIFTEVGKALIRVWENENNEGEIVLKQELDANGDLVDLAPLDYVTLTFKGELRKLLYSVGLLMSNEIPFDPVGDGGNNWPNTGPMTDLERVLLSAEGLLADDIDILSRTTLREYLKDIIYASSKFDKTSAMGDGADSLNGILGTYYNPVYFSGFDYGLDYAFKHNMDKELRTEAGADKTSAFRTVLYLLEGFNVEKFGIAPFELTVGDLVAIFLDSPDGMVYRKNMLDFFFGEVATANEKSGYDDAFEILDYVLYEKIYCLVIIPFPGFFNMINSFDSLLGDPTIGWIIAVIMDGMDFTVMNSGKTMLGIDVSKESNGTGCIHQMFFFPRVLEHFYFQPYPGRTGQDGQAGWETSFQHGWEREVVEFAASLNELPAFAPLAPYDFATDPDLGVMKALEGPDGYGLVTYLLRDHLRDPSSDASDDGWLDPVLYMLSMVVNELINTTYDDPDNNYTYYNGSKYAGSLWAALMDHIKDHKLLGLNLDDLDNLVDPDDPDSGYKVLAYWFDPVDPDSDDDAPLDIVRDLLSELHVDIDTYAKDIGRALVKLIAENDGAGYDQIEEDIVAIMDILDLVTADVDLISVEGFKGIIDYLLEEEDGSDNEFIAHIKAIFIKLLDLKVDRTIGADGKDDIERIHGGKSYIDRRVDTKYYEDLYTRKASGAAYWFKGTENEGVSEPHNGSIDDDATLADLVKHLFGEDENLKGGLYSVSNVKDYVDEVFEDSFMTSFLFEYFIEEPLSDKIVQHAPDFSKNNKGFALTSLLGMFFFDHDSDEWNLFNVTYIRKIGFSQIDIDGNGILDMELFCGAFMYSSAMETDMTGLFEDLVLYWGGPSLRPGGSSWEVWEGIWVFWENAEDIF